MAFKKKSGLRDRATKNSSVASKIESFRKDQDSSVQHDENPLLKLSKTSKKEKQQTKTSTFNERLASKGTFNTSSGVSKSTLRRRKRKEKEQLKPKMDDLLSSLPAATVNIVDSRETKKSFIKAVSTKPANMPNPQKHSVHTKLLEVENKNFSKVLQDKQFQQSPFAALKQAISQNMK